MTGLGLGHIPQFGLFALIQLIISSVLALLLWMTVGFVAAYSALIGGGVALVGSLIYALILCRVDERKPSSILRLHLIAELAKLCAMFSAVGVLFFVFRQINWIWFFAGFLAAYSAYWVGLLMKN